MKWEHFSWFLDHFTGAKYSGSVILILDGRVSNSSDLPALQKALTNDVFLLCLPPHCTQKLQLLDVAFFGSLKLFYNDACTIYIRRNLGKGLNKVAFGGIFTEAWNPTATVGKAISGFKTCGIFPFNRNQLPEHVFPLPPE
jgi:hypothetical protein